MSVLFVSGLYAQDLASRAEPFFRALTEQGKFSGVVLFAKDGNEVFARAYGMANRDWNIPNSLDTKFRIGSITKQFTAAAILKLEEQGKLKVTDSACDYLTACPAAWKNVTIHHLLSHTSGITDFTDLEAYEILKTRPSRYDEQVKAVWELPLKFPPGEKFDYSNTGYVMLGKIIEKASGIPFEAYFEREIFAPAGMKSTRVDSNEAVIRNRAEGYLFNGGRPRKADYIDMRIPGAAGSVVSTAHDLVLWDRALASNKVLSPASRKKMLIPNKANYAYGTMVDKVGGKQADGHNGGIDGFVSLFQRIPEDGLAVVIFSNFEDIPADEVMPGVHQLALGQSPKIPQQRQEMELDLAVLREYVGRYQLAPQFVIEITLEGTQLMTQATGQAKIPVYAEAKDVLFPKVIDATLQIVREGSKVVGLILKQNGREIKGQRLP